MAIQMLIIDANAYMLDHMKCMLVCVLWGKPGKIRLTFVEMFRSIFGIIFTHVILISREW